MSAMVVFEEGAGAPGGKCPFTELNESIATQREY